MNWKQLEVQPRLIFKKNNFPSFLPESGKTEKSSQSHSKKFQIVFVNIEKLGITAYH